MSRSKFYYFKLDRLLTDFVSVLVVRVKSFLCFLILLLSTTWKNYAEVLIKRQNKSFRIVKLLILHARFVDFRYVF